MPLKQLKTLIGCLIFTPFIAFASALDGELEVGTNLVLTYQQSNRTLPLQDIENEMLFSMDLELEQSHNGSGWFGWIEFSNNTKNNGVTQFFDDANSDAGTTADATGNGRVQISSLYYYQNDENQPISWQFGLAEVSTLIDASDIANDEVAQFLSAGLVNNETIPFPDYALSSRVVLNDIFRNSKLVLLLASGHGLADNDGNYAKTLNPFKSGQGAFLATEFQWLKEDLSLSIGIWKNSVEESLGWYSTIDKTFNHIEFNARLGAANMPNSPEQELTEEAPNKKFIGLSIRYPLSKGEFGIGWTYSERYDLWRSRERNIEGYFRYPVGKSLHITPSFQLHNGQLINGIELKDSVITGLRLQYSF